MTHRVEMAHFRLFGGGRGRPSLTAVMSGGFEIGRGHRMTLSKSPDMVFHKKAKNYTRKEMLLRVLWGFFKPLFRFSPRTFFGYRCLLLRVFGAKIGKSVRIYNTAVVYFPWNLKVGNLSAIGEWALIYNLGKVVIGDNATISQRTHLCAGTHDYNDPSFPLQKPPIFIQDQVWVCADAFIGPGVTVGKGAVVGARAVVTHDVGAWEIVAGNPARFIKNRVLNAPSR